MSINNENHGFTVFALVLFIPGFINCFLIISLHLDVVETIISTVVTTTIALILLYCFEKCTKFNALSWNAERRE